MAKFDGAPPRAPRAGAAVPDRAYTERRREAEARGSRVPPRLRKWGVALLLLLAFSGMLYATFRYVQNVRGGAAAQQPRRQQAVGAPENKTGIVGSEFVTTTGVNLREGPDTSYNKIGLAETGSRVRVLQEPKGRWVLVEVIEYSRPKADPDGSDKGWVNSINLKRS